MYILWFPFLFSPLMYMQAKFVLLFINRRVILVFGESSRNYVLYNNLNNRPTWLKFACGVSWSYERFEYDEFPLFLIWNIHLTKMEINSSYPHRDFYLLGGSRKVSGAFSIPFSDCWCGELIIFWGKPSSEGWVIISNSGPSLI